MYTFCTCAYITTARSKYARLALVRLQERLGRDGLDDTTSVATSGGSDALLGLQDIPVRKSKSQLTSTEFALQEIRWVKR